MSLRDSRVTHNPDEMTTCTLSTGEEGQPPHGSPTGGRLLRSVVHNSPSASSPVSHHLSPWPTILYSADLVPPPTVPGPTPVGSRGTPDSILRPVVPVRVLVPLEVSSAGSGSLSTVTLRRGPSDDGRTGRGW